MLKHTRLSLIVLFVLVIVFVLPLSESSAVLKNDAAEADEYVIEPEDVISIIVAGYEEDYNQTMIVQPTGEIKYMSLGGDTGG